MEEDINIINNGRTVKMSSPYSSVGKATGFMLNDLGVRVRVPV
jgi:hypothetical protein